MNNRSSPETFPVQGAESPEQEKSVRERADKLSSTTGYSADDARLIAQNNGTFINLNDGSTTPEYSREKQAAEAERERQAEQAQREREKEKEKPAPTPTVPSGAQTSENKTPTPAPLPETATRGAGGDDDAPAVEAQSYKSGNYGSRGFSPDDPQTATPPAHPTVSEDNPAPTPGSEAPETLFPSNGFTPPIYLGGERVSGREEATPISIWPGTLGASDRIKPRSQPSEQAGEAEPILTSEELGVLSHTVGTGSGEEQIDNMLEQAMRTAEQNEKIRQGIGLSDMDPDKLTAHNFGTKEKATAWIAENRSTLPQENGEFYYPNEDGTIGYVTPEEVQTAFENGDTERIFKVLPGKMTLEYFGKTFLGSAGDASAEGAGKGSMSEVKPDAPAPSTLAGPSDATTPAPSTARPPDAPTGEVSSDALAPQATGAPTSPVPEVSSTPGPSPKSGNTDELSQILGPALEPYNPSTTPQDSEVVKLKSDGSQYLLRGTDNDLGVKNVGGKIQVTILPSGAGYSLVEGNDGYFVSADSSFYPKKEYSSIEELAADKSLPVSQGIRSKFTNK